jgi:hypothetical protein
MDQMMDMEPQPPQVTSFRPGPVIAGVILLAVGAAMLLDTTGTVDVHLGQMIAPLVMIGLGASILLEKGSFVCGGRRELDEQGRERYRVRKRSAASGGVWLIGIGIWMMVSQMHLFGLNYGNSWPLFIILSGIMTMIRGVR